MATILNAVISQFPISKPSPCFQFHNRNHVSLSSKLSFKSVNITTRTHKNPSSIKCSILDKTIEGLRASGRGYDAGTLGYKTDTGPDLLHMIHGYHSSMNEVPGKEGDDVLSKLRNVISSLMSEERYQDALEVNQWINNWKERDEMTPEDTAREVYLIATVHGVSSAEKYFMKLSDAMKDERTYSALLIRYMDARMQINAESFYNKMRNAGYASDEISFFTMLKFYEDLKDNDKVELLISKMIEENIPLSRHSFNIWLWSCQNQESLDKLFKQAQRETTCRSSFDRFSSIAIMYNELGQLEKAQDCLNEIESRITDERHKFRYLIGLCDQLHNKQELYRVWENYKSVFPKYSSDGYSSVIFCLFEMDDIEGAEKIYEEWLSQPDGSDSEDIIEELGNDDSDSDSDSDSNSNSNSNSNSDSDSDYGDVIDEPGNYKRNYLLHCYVRKGLFKEAETFFNQMIEVGIKPNPFMWENLALLHIQERRISKALSCLRKFFSARGKGWETCLPSPKTVRYLLEICFEESDDASKEALYQIFEEARISKSSVEYLVTPHLFL